MRILITKRAREQARHSRAAVLQEKGAMAANPAAVRSDIETNKRKAAELRRQAQEAGQQ